MTTTIVRIVESQLDVILLGPCLDKALDLDMHGGGEQELLIDCSPLRLMTEHVPSWTQCTIPLCEDSLTEISIGFFYRAVGLM